MDDQPRPHRLALLTVALLLGVSLLGVAPHSAAAMATVLPQVPPNSNTWIRSNTGNGTDYTVGYEPVIRQADGTLIASGTELVGGDTGRLVAGQFAWVEGNTVQHQIVTGADTTIEVGRVRVVPALGWFLAAQRVPGGLDPDLRDGEGTPFVPEEGESFAIRLDWEARAGCPADVDFDAWTGALGATRAYLDLAYQTSGDNPNRVAEDSNHRHDKLNVIVKAPVPATAMQCRLDVHYHFLLRVVSETSYPNPSVGLLENDPNNLFVAEQQELRIYVGGALAKATPTTVSYVPIVFVNWVCTMVATTVPVPADCANEALAAADAGGAMAVAFPKAGGGGFYGLVMGETPGGMQGALTFIPSPYTSYQISRTKLVTVDSTYGYREFEWPAPTYNY